MKKPRASIADTSKAASHACWRFGSLQKQIPEIYCDAIRSLESRARTPVQNNEHNVSTS